MGFEQLYDLLGLPQKVGSAAGVGGASQSFYLLIGYFLYGLLIFGGLLFVIWYFYRQSKYKIDVTLYELTGTEGNKQLVMHNDRGAFIHTKEGEQKFKLLRRKKVVLPPPNRESYTIKMKKVFGILRVIDSVSLVHYGSSDYDYLPINYNIKESLKEHKLQSFPFSNVNWGIREVKSDALKFKALMDKLQAWALPISLVVIVILVGVICYWISGNIKQMIEVSANLPACNPNL